MQNKHESRSFLVQKLLEMGTLHLYAILKVQGMSNIIAYIKLNTTDILLGAAN